MGEEKIETSATLSLVATCVHHVAGLTLLTSLTAMLVWSSSVRPESAILPESAMFVTSAAVASPALRCNATTVSRTNAKITFSFSL